MVNRQYLNLIVEYPIDESVIAHDQLPHIIASYLRDNSP